MACHHSGTPLGEVNVESDWTGLPGNKV